MVKVCLTSGTLLRYIPSSEKKRVAEEDRQYKYDMSDGGYRVDSSRQETSAAILPNRGDPDEPKTLGNQLSNHADQCTQYTTKYTNAKELLDIIRRVVDYADIATDEIAYAFKNSTEGSFDLLNMQKRIDEKRFIEIMEVITSYSFSNTFFS
ncbi:hypothetical protein CRE_07218 [Caenorhabditis remanei]|uniref:Uncharacterized protein n=1 Tax=Caenorhabditis remanei TaxID=31234 RepID=E3M2X9_CAERE|nr:hypothetical protein CRE_07218 [Caenorhabditis remanei]